MPANKDIRSTRTKKALSDAMLALLAHTEFQNISVHEICGKAQVSRTTFYAHFEDKYHLARYSLYEFIAEAVQHAGEEEDARDKLRSIFVAIDQNKSMFRNILEDDDQELEQTIHAQFVEGVHLSLEQEQQKGKLHILPAHMLAVFLSSGLTSMLTWWISGSLQATAGELADAFVIILEQYSA